MTVELTLTADRRLEWAVGKVRPEKMEWMYQDYFGAVGPVMAEHGMKNLVGFEVRDASGTGVKPTAGALTTWPSAEARIKLHKDARFTPWLPERDDAFDIFEDGYFIEALEEVLTLNTDQDYAVVISSKQPLEAAIFDQAMTTDSPNQKLAGKSLALYPWSDAADALLAAPAEGMEVYRIRFNPKVR